jgi:hypothetical protein
MLLLTPPVSKIYVYFKSVGLAAQTRIRAEVEGLAQAQAIVALVFERILFKIVLLASFN